TLTSDAKGLLSLYEAANVRIHGEDILEDAVTFTTHHLNCMVQELEPLLRCQVKRALEQQFTEALQDWKVVEPARFDIKTTLRERQIGGGVFLGHGFPFSASALLCRIAVTKSVLMLTIMDDTYDNYATLEEADIFTEILKRLKSISKESIDWLMSEPNKSLIASTRICRHADDIGSDEGWKYTTAVDCYAKQYVSKEETVDKFNELYENAWKDFNTEWSTEISTISKDMMEQLLNYARAAEVNYRNGRDAYANPKK
ncbi:UNVERIFIED_CONTAM: Gamma-curcumene synthase, partial [Sesamum latifolium]